MASFSFLERFRDKCSRVSKHGDIECESKPQSKPDVSQTSSVQKTAKLMLSQYQQSSLLVSNRPVSPKKSFNLDYSKIIPDSSPEKSATNSKDRYSPKRSTLPFKYTSNSQSIQFREKLLITNFSPNKTELYGKDGDQSREDSRTRKGLVRETLKHSYIGASNLYDVDSSNRIPNLTDFDARYNYETINQEREHYSRINKSSTYSREMYNNQQITPVTANYRRTQMNN